MVKVVADIDKLHGFNYRQIKFYSTGSRCYVTCHLSGVYTGDKTLHVVTVASDGDLKRWEDFY
jgi:hypothetical protein